MFIPNADDFVPPDIKSKTILPVARFGKLFLGFGVEVKEDSRRGIEPGKKRLTFREKIGYITGRPKNA